MSHCELEDHKNPDFIFNALDTELLVKAAKGEIDLNRLVRVQLAQRGLDENGEWVGFRIAAQIHNCK